MDLSVLDANAVKKTTEFHIDSSIRDKGLYPNPNAYTIEFVENFHNVVGMEILDARIPKSDYLINVRNNRIKITIGDKGYVYNIPIGDYSSDEFVETFNDNTFGIIISKVNKNRPQFVFRSSVKFDISISETTLSKLLGLHSYTNQIITAQKDDTFYEHISYQPLLYDDDVSYIESDLDKIYVNEIFIQENPDAPTKEYYLKRIHIPDMEFINSFGYVQTVQFVIDIIDSNTQRVCGTVSQFTNDFVFDSIRLEPNTRYYVHLYTKNKEWYDPQLIKLPVRKNIYHTTLVSDGISMESPDPITNSYPMKIDNELAGINMHIVIEDRLYTILAPGRFNLLGENYVVLRCKEIDRHFQNGVKRNNNTTFVFGSVIRLSELGSVEERYRPPSDTLVEFTPIHKLSRMSFVIENLEGTLYDFKGFDHNFTIRLSFMSMQSNIHYPFKQQQLFDEVEAINEKVQYYVV